MTTTEDANWLLKVQTGRLLFLDVMAKRSNSKSYKRQACSFCFT